MNSSTVVLCAVLGSEMSGVVAHWNRERHSKSISNWIYTEKCCRLYGKNIWNNIQQKIDWVFEYEKCIPYIFSKLNGCWYRAEPMPNIVATKYRQQFISMINFLCWALDSGVIFAVRHATGSERIATQLATNSEPNHYFICISRVCVFMSLCLSVFVCVWYRNWIDPHGKNINLEVRRLVFGLFTSTLFYMHRFDRKTSIANTKKYR